MHFGMCDYHWFLDSLAHIQFTSHPLIIVSQYHRQTSLKPFLLIEYLRYLNLFLETSHCAGIPIKSYKGLIIDLFHQIMNVVVKNPSGSN